MISANAFVKYAIRAEEETTFTSLFELALRLSRLSTMGRRKGDRKCDDDDDEEKDDDADDDDDHDNDESGCDVP